MEKMKDLFREFDPSYSDKYDAEEANYPGGYAGCNFNRYYKKMAWDVSKIVANDGSDYGKALYQRLDDILLRRQLSYSGCRIPLKLVRGIKKGIVRVTDFGCGIGHNSIFLCLELIARGDCPKLTLIDFNGKRLDFALWVANRLGIEAVSIGAPVDSLPESDVVVAIDVMEHLHDPITALRMFVNSLQKGGTVWGTFGNYRTDGVLHVTHNLTPLINELVNAGFEEVESKSIYRRPYERPSPT